jgi:hypothetical protein
LSLVAVSSSDLFPFPPYNFSTIVSKRGSTLTCLSLTLHLRGLET